MASFLTAPLWAYYSNTAVNFVSNIFIVLSLLHDRRCIPFERLQKAFTYPSWALIYFPGVLFIVDITKIQLVENPKANF